jgi:putative ABC transport system permease protein
VLHLRTRARPAELIAPVRQLLRSLDPQMPIVETATLREEVETSLWQERLLAGFSGIFAAIGALLAGVGIYGALDLAVKSRTREIGVRVALGADALRVIKLLASEVLLLVVCGTAAGLALFATSKLWLGSVLYGVSAADPAAPAATLLLVAVITLIATAIPAWRAVTIDPATALRHE